MKMKNRRNGAWMSLMVKVVMILLTFHFSLFTSHAAEKHKFTLVIDAGHGGKDAGAKGKYSYEKNINLNVALAFGRYVEKNCPDVRVIYTRKTDVFIPLHQRADIANKNKADIFISVHTNAIAGKGSPVGLETYTMGLRRSGEKLSAAMRENEVVLIEKDYQQHYAGFDPRMPESYIIFEVLNERFMAESVELAQMIQKNVCATAGRPNKGVKQDAFLVLRETSMPACLIELGYITTPKEEDYLNNKANIDALGKGIYQAFLEYKKKHDKNPTVQPQPAQQEEQPASPEKQQPASQEQPTEQPEKLAEVPAKPVEQPAKPAEQPAKPVEQPAKLVELPAKQDTLVEQPAKPEKEVQPEKIEPKIDNNAPVFKVQFLTSGTRLKAGNRQFKGLTGVESYKDGNVWKYTVGASNDYQAIQTLRREVAKQFPEAFVVAFRHGERMDINEAREAYRKNKQKK